MPVVPTGAFSRSLDPEVDPTRHGHDGQEPGNSRQRPYGYIARTVDEENQGENEGAGDGQRQQQRESPPHEPPPLPPVIRDDAEWLEIRWRRGLGKRQWRDITFGRGGAGARCEH